MQKLTKEQVRMLITLGEQKKNLQNSLEEVQSTEQEFFKMILKYYDLEEGEYKLLQEGEDIFIKKVTRENVEDSKVEMEE